MIKKAYRLSETQLGKVLKYKKPFFSNMMVGNVIESREIHPRFAIVLSGKVTKTSVDRNFFRRNFYNVCAKYLKASPRDIVVVIKKGNILSRKLPEDALKFTTDLEKLLRTIFSSELAKNPKLHTIYKKNPPTPSNHER